MKRWWAPWLALFIVTNLALWLRDIEFPYHLGLCVGMSFGCGRLFPMPGAEQ